MKKYDEDDEVIMSDVGNLQEKDGKIFNILFNIPQKMKRFLLGLATLMFALTPVFAENDNGITAHKTNKSEFESLCNSAIAKLNNGQSNISEFSCDMEVKNKIRYRYGLNFGDIFDARWHDRWIWSHCSLIIEQDKDYNESGRPETIELKLTPWLTKTMNRKIPKGVSWTIIKSNDTYRVNKHPEERKENNIEVRYAVVYSNESSSSSQMYYHTECDKYEITWCGDGTKDEDYGEECDLWKDNGKLNSSCTADCKKTTPLSCGTASWWTTYFASKQTSSWLSANDSRLCATWLTPKILGVKWDDGHLEWTCSNANGNVSCKAYQEYCGDGKIKEWKENCDPEHPSYKWKWICKSNCTLETPKCNSEYNGKRVYREGSTLQFWNWPNNLCSIWDVIKNNPFGTWTSWSPRIYEWNCKVENNTTNPSCSLKEYRCGDGIRSASWTNWNYSNGAHYEACDPTSPEWKNWRDGQTCKSNCTTEYNIPLCGSKYKNQKKYQDINNQWLTSNTPGLCDEWQVVEFNFDRTTWKYQWYCKNGSKKSDPCLAQQLWCGDWKVNETEPNKEACDPADTRSPSVKWWWEWTLKTCSSSCELEPIKWPACNSQYDKQTKYQSILSWEWLNANMNPSLCANWQVSSFNSDKKSPRTFTWNCVVNWVSTWCTAKQQRCGDGEKNWGEVCDPNDTVNKKWWWDAWCSQTCDKAIYSSGVCGSKYNKTKTYLDISEDYITSTTPWLCDKWNVVNFHKHSSSRVYTWQCENHWNYSEQCRADQEWCGDGKVTEWKEACDP